MPVKIRLIEGLHLTATNRRHLAQILAQGWTRGDSGRLLQAAEWEEAQHRAWSAGMGHKMARRRAVLRAMNLRAMLRDEKAMSDARLAEALRNADKARLAEQIAEDHLRMREAMRGQLCAMERRAEAAEAENAELWAEIEALTAPDTAAHHGAIPTQAGAA